MKKVGIIMGSDSDLPVVEKAITTLRELEIPCEVHVYSAHRTPLEAKELSIQYEGAETLNGNALILEKMGKTIKKSVDTAFPACEYALEICADKEGIPQSIRVIGGGEKAFEISNFIQGNYGLEVTTDQGGTQNEAR